MSNTSENTTGEGNAGETEDIGTADDEETDRQTETEVVTDLTEESETTTDEETGLTISDVMEQADEEGIDLYSLDEGESVTFMARVASTTVWKKVTVTRGTCYQYSYYGYGKLFLDLSVHCKVWKCFCYCLLYSAGKIQSRKWNL